jgi:hypothetical protein
MSNDFATEFRNEPRNEFVSVQQILVGDSKDDDEPFEAPLYQYVDFRVGVWISHNFMEPSADADTKRGATRCDFTSQTASECPTRVRTAMEGSCGAKLGILNGGIFQIRMVESILPENKVSSTGDTATVVTGAE